VIVVFGVKVHLGIGRHEGDERRHHCDAFLAHVVVGLALVGRIERRRPQARLFGQFAHGRLPGRFAGLEVPGRVGPQAMEVGLGAVQEQRTGVLALAADGNYRDERTARGNAIHVLSPTGRTGRRCHRRACLGFSGATP